MEKNILVIDSSERHIGTTYPKRARGLVKNGRAEFVDDCTIRLLNPCPTHIMEDNDMDHRLFFNAREWKLNPECIKNQGTRSFISGVDGNLAEAYTIGNWDMNGSQTEIISPSYLLDKNSEYTFTFWLNGGENDRNGDEVCQLQIIYNNDKNNALVYNLNRNYIKPLKRIRGWNLYEIPFVTSENEYTQLKFVAKAAFTTIMNSLGKEAYEDMEDELDEFEGLRPQRHNIVWEDGWPTNVWYSTKNLREVNSRPNGMPYQGKQSGASSKLFGARSRKGPFGVPDEFATMSDDKIDFINQESFRKEILDKIDFEAIQSDIIEQLDLDAMKERIMQHTIEALKNEIESETNDK